MNMFSKLLALVAITALICTAGLGQSTDEAGKDTVIINFGDKSKLVIYADSKQDLDAMLNYDINAMLQDLSRAIRESDREIEYLKIKDESGERYLKDTTITLTGADIKKEARLRIGNVKVEVDVENWDEDEFEDIDSVKIKKEDYEEDTPLRTKQYFNVHLGINSHTNDNAYPNGDLAAVKPWGSWYVALSSVFKTPVSGPLFLEWGGNVSWYSFKLEEEHVRIISGENQIIYQRASPEIRGRKSKLTTSFINVSLVPMLDFSHGRRKVKSLDIGSGNVKLTKYKKQGFRVGLGAYAGYRLGSHTAFKYEENGDNQKDNDRGKLYLNNFRYGARMQMGYKGLDLFFNYDLNGLFEEGKGPDVNAFSFGIIL